MASTRPNGPLTKPEIGRVWSQGFEALGTRLGEILIAAFFFGGLPVALLRVVSGHISIAYGTSIWMKLVTTVAMSTLTSVLGVTAAYALISRLVVSVLDGRAEPAASAIDNVVRRFPALIVMATLVNCGVGLATILLIVPGLMLMSAWAMVIQTASMEKLGPIEALRRSAALTRGARWQVFGVIVVLGIAGGVGIYLINRFANAFYGGAGAFNLELSQGWPLWYIAATAVFQCFVISVSAAVHAALYVQLRDWKDGPDADNLAEVFA